MSLGLIALLDDVTAIAKAAAASVDDVAAQAARSSAKSAGLVIDDAAVTPRYVVGFAPAREIPIVMKIAKGSLINKAILLPAMLLLAAFAPWAVTPLLMLGASYLCFEGAEKVHEALFPHAAHPKEGPSAAEDPAKAEAARVSGAIRTDFILSAEIMAVTLSTVADRGIGLQAGVLAVVGLLITVVVYGAVALIVKADDAGLYLAANGRTGFGRVLGRGLVAGVPWLLRFLTVAGTAAMLWVGGGIIVHSLAGYGWAGIEHAVHEVSVAAAGMAGGIAGAVGWAVEATGFGLVGLALGALLIPVVTKVLAPLASAVRG